MFSRPSGVDLSFVLHTDQSRFDCREQRGVTTDLGSDPTLVRIVITLSSTSSKAHYVQAHSNISCPRCGHEEYVLILTNHQIVTPTHAFHSAVFYQDQSKRKETRMILFFVCTKCNHSFMDPTLPTESRPEVMEDS
jgi:DNA-directed RNA polymerase subunit M/transcription elongation factor TFIIS